MVCGDKRETKTLRCRKSEGKIRSAEIFEQRQRKTSEEIEAMITRKVKGKTRQLFAVYFFPISSGCANGPRNVSFRTRPDLIQTNKALVTSRLSLAKVDRGCVV